MLYRHSLHLLGHNNALHINRSLLPEKGIDTELAGTPSPVNTITPAHDTACLDITWSRIQDEPDNDLEMVTGNCDFDSFTDIDIGCGKWRD